MWRGDRAWPAPDYAYGTEQKQDVCRTGRQVKLLDQSIKPKGLPVRTKVKRGKISKSGDISCRV